MPKNCRARFSASGGRLALMWTLPLRGEAGKARPLAVTSLRSCARPSVCAASLRFASAHRVGGAAVQSAALCPLDCASPFSTPDCGRSSGFVSRTRNEAGKARVGGRRGAAMPRPLLDSVHRLTFLCCLGLARALERGFAPLVADRYAARRASPIATQSRRGYVAFGNPHFSPAFVDWELDGVARLPLER